MKPKFFPLVILIMFWNFRVKFGKSNNNYNISKRHWGKIIYWNTTLWQWFRTSQLVRWNFKTFWKRKRKQAQLNVFGIARHLLFTLSVSLLYPLVSFDLGWFNNKWKHWNSKFFLFQICRGIFCGLSALRQNKIVKAFFFVVMFSSIILIFLLF